MTVMAIREQLHQLIDTLPETYLLELWRLIQRLQLFWSDKPTPSNDSELLKLVAQIKNTPPRLSNVTLPTKSGATCIEINHNVMNEVEVNDWNEQWDSIEAEMKAHSLAHELAEQQDSWESL